MDEFSQKIVLTVVDKLAIGLLIVFAIFYFNRLLERYRLEQNKVLEAFKAEQNKVLEQLKGEQSLRAFALCDSYARCTDGVAGVS